MTLQEAVAARYERQATEQAAARETRKPGDPEPVSLYAGVESALRRRPGVVWPTVGGGKTS